MDKWTRLLKLVVNSLIYYSEFLVIRWSSDIEINHNKMSIKQSQPMVNYSVKTLNNQIYGTLKYNNNNVGYFTLEQYLTFPK